MKKTVRVTIEKEIEVEIPDSHLTPEYLVVFSETMWDVEEPDDLFRYAARHIAYYGDLFIEGLGEVNGHYATTEPGDIVYRELMDESEEDVLPDNA